MAKVTLDWKSPSDKKMVEYVQTLGEDKKKDFAESCIVKKDGKNILSKGKAKKWLLVNAKAEDIEWKNKPENTRAMSSADLAASWLNL